MQFQPMAGATDTEPLYEVQLFESASIAALVVSLSLMYRILL